MTAGYCSLSFFSVAAGMVTAYDTSRAGVVIAPLILVGLGFFARATGPHIGLRYCVGSIALGNLLLPTTHVIIAMTDTIRSLPAEFSKL